MCRFFEKLHKDAGGRLNFEPLSDEELKKFGCLDLDYENIISETFNLESENR